jgi:hypothetical protein
MQVKIFINDKLWKTVPVEGDSYQPNLFWKEMKAEKDAGLLSSFDVQNGIKLKFEVIK